MTVDPRDARDAAGERDARDELVVFARLLRAAGIDLGTGQVVAFTEAARQLAPVDLDDLYWAGRATLACRRTDIVVYDRVFRTFYRAGAPTVEVTDARDERAPIRLADADAASRPGKHDGERAGGEASDFELLRHRRFDQASAAELAAMRMLMARIPLAVPPRRSRRTAPLRRGRAPDLRRTVRRAIQTDGELVRRAWRHRRSRPRPLVLLLDVSGSMAGYSRALLQFAFSARAGRGPLEVFCFGTRLTRVTDELGDRDPDEALRAASRRVVDWDGGTQIGASLDLLNRRWGRRGRLRGAVVVVCSDGLERGDVEVLRDAMARLRRSAHRVVWVNPLKGDDRYEPVQRGMRAALPSVDRLVAGHDLASLHALAEVLGAMR